MSRAPRLSVPSREKLLDEAEHVRKSLEDLDRERGAGDLEGADYEMLRASYEHRAATVNAALRQASALKDAEDQRSGISPAGRRPGTRPFLLARKHRPVLGWSAAGCFAAAGLLAGLALAGVAPFASTKPPALSVASRIRIELAEAGVLASNRDIVQAVAVYDRVLELDPGQPEALANGGWLVRLAGLSSQSSRVVSGGDAEIAAAVRVAPRYALARAYDGVALYEDGHLARAAVTEFRAMLVDRPSSTLLASVRATALAAYHAARAPVPAMLSQAAASAST